MDDRLALMATIVANPFDDTPRLVFADWLDEHGDPARAEFIRLQCEAEALPKDSARRTKLEARAAKIQTKHEAVWMGPLGPLFGREPFFRRGFLNHWVGGAGDFVTAAFQKAAVAALPTLGLGSLAFTSPTKKLGKVAASPALAWVSGVDLETDNASDKDLPVFLTPPHLGRLAELELSAAKCTDAGLAALADTTALPNLQSFALTSGTPQAKYTSAGVVAVIRGKRFPRLDRLDVDGRQPSKFNYEGLLAAPELKRLTRLALGWATPMAVVAHSPHLGGLRFLSVSSSRITDADAVALADNPSLATVERLTLHGMNWGQPRLSKAAEGRLRERFGERLALDYSPEQK